MTHKLFAAMMSNMTHLNLLKSPIDLFNKFTKDCEIYFQ